MGCYSRNNTSLNLISILFSPPKFTLSVKDYGRLCFVDRLDSFFQLHWFSVVHFSSYNTDELLASKMSVTAKYSTVTANDGIWNLKEYSAMLILLILLLYWKLVSVPWVKNMAQVWFFCLMAYQLLWVI